MTSFENRNIHNSQQQLLFIDANVSDYQSYLSNSTAAIIYDHNTTCQEVMSFIKLNLPQLKRVGIVFHENAFPLFLGLYPFFTPGDIDENTTVKLQRKVYQNLPLNFSQNLQFMVDIVNHYSLRNIDFLTPNLLTHPSWKLYFQILNVSCDVIIGSSYDYSGNIKYGADWIIQQSFQDFQSIYFIPSIKNYSTIIPYIRHNNISFIIHNNTAHIVGSFGISQSSFTIPTTIQHNNTPITVESVYGFSFDDRKIFNEIFVPKSISTLHSGAFSFCSSLQYIDSLQHLHILHPACFNGCKKLTSVLLSPNIQSIPPFLFKDCTSITLINIPDTVHTISYSSFENTSSLTKLILPSSLTNIDDAFHNSGISNIVISRTSLVQCLNFSLINFSNIQSLIIPDNIKHIGPKFWDCSNNSLTHLAFMGNSLPQIDKNAFSSDIHLTAYINDNNIDINQLSTHFPQWTFSLFEFIPDLTIDNITYSFSNNFTGYVKDFIYESEDVQYDITILPEVKANEFFYDIVRIDDSVFKNTNNINSISFPQGLLQIGNYTFANSTLSTFNLPDTIQTIGSYAFQDAKLSYIHIPTSLQHLGMSVFHNCSLLSCQIHLPSSLTSIPPSCWEGCVELSSIFINGPITSIGNSAFKNCKKLTKCIFHDTLHLSTISSYSFFNCNSLSNLNNNDTFHLPCLQNVSSYSFSHTNNLSLSLVIEHHNPGYIETNAFYDSAIHNITMNHCTHIGEYAFALSSLQIFDFPALKSMDPIGNQCHKCYDLTTIILTPFLSRIERYFASYCTSLTQINTFEYLEFIHPDYSFYGCKSLQNIPSLYHLYENLGDFRYSNLSSIELNPSIKTFGKFSNNLHLSYIGQDQDEPVSFPNIRIVQCDEGFSNTSLSMSFNLPSCHTIQTKSFASTLIQKLFLPELITCESYAFSQSTITHIYIPKLQQIEPFLFYACDHLTYCQLSENVTSILTSAFSGCLSLTTMIFPSSLTQISQDAFSCSGIKHAYFDGFILPSFVNKPFKNVTFNAYTISPYTDITNHLYDNISWNVHTYVPFHEQPLIDSSSDDTYIFQTLTKMPITDEISGKTHSEKRKYTQRIIRCLFDTFKIKNIALSSKLTLPGFVSQNKDVFLFYDSHSDPSSAISTIYDKNELIGKNFYILLDKHGDSITLPTLSNKSIHIRQLVDQYEITTPLSKLTYTDKGTFVYDGLVLTFNGIFGQLPLPEPSLFPYSICQLNTRYHSIYSVSKRSPNTLLYFLYDNNNNLIHKKSIKYSTSIKNILAFFEKHSNHSLLPEHCNELFPIKTRTYNIHFPEKNHSTLIRKCKIQKTKN